MSETPRPPVLAGDAPSGGGSPWLMSAPPAPDLTIIEQQGV